MDEERIDFSALDPRRDPARFEQMVKAVVAGAAARPPSPHPFLRTLAGQGRMVALVAAALALVAWLPNLGASLSGASPSQGTTESDPVDLVSTWAQSGQVPTDVDLFQALGDFNGG